MKSRSNGCEPKVLRPTTGSPLLLRIVAGIVMLMPVVTTGGETWHGLTVAPEHRCTPYDRKRDYPYPQSIEQDIVRQLGAVYGPYTGTCFGSTKDTDIEHIVAASEAHDSGLCAADRATKRRFARDLRNLTLASPRVNRHQKSGMDAGEWVPGPEPVLVRRTRSRGQACLPPHRRPPRGCGT